LERRVNDAILSKIGRMRTGETDGPRQEDKSMQSGSIVRLCRDDEGATILTIINGAAEAYRGVIPADQWHEPYISLQELNAEIAAGVEFWAYERDGALLGVMGIQPVRDVDLIRHAYVLSNSQRHGVGAVLIKHLRGLSARRMLVGTWAAATWAISFYRRHDFEIVPPERRAELLRMYWTISDRQIETSVVLANPPLAGP
jgi:GNAT superfamily N-acetyltransferase